MTLRDVHVVAGNEVRLIRALPGQYRQNTNDRFDLPEGDTFTVTRVFADSLLVKSHRFFDIREVRGYTHRIVAKQASFQINRENFIFRDADYTPPPPPRKLGTKPEDTEEMEYLDIDHPGIQWLFDDMGVYADKQGYCSQYDALCVKLGIPGRPRDFDVRRTVNGLELRTSVKARSQAEANRIVDAALNPSTEPDLATA